MRVGVIIETSVLDDVFQELCTTHGFFADRAREALKQAVETAPILKDLNGWGLRRGIKECEYPDGAKYFEVKKELEEEK